MNTIRFEYRGGKFFKQEPIWTLYLNDKEIARSKEYDTEKQCSKDIDKIIYAIRRHKNPSEIKVVKNRHCHNLNLENP